MLPILSLLSKNTTDDADGARLRFVKDKGAAGDDNDVVGVIEFYGDDDAQDQVLFARIQAEVADASNGAEGGKLVMGIATHDGEMQTGLLIADGNAEDEVDVTIGNGVDSLVSIAGDMALLYGAFAVGSDASGDMYYRNADGILARIAVGSDDHVLTLNGAVPGWEAASGGGGSPGGSDTQVQFNDSDSFGGDSGLTFNKTSNVLTVGGLSNAGSTVIDRVSKASGDSPYTMVATDHYIGLDTSGGTIQVDLQAAASAAVEGRVIIIKDETGDAGTNNITVDANGSETIDGSTHTSY